jgi:hypothetical protein
MRVRKALGTVIPTLALVMGLLAVSPATTVAQNGDLGVTIVSPDAGGILDRTVTLQANVVNAGAAPL